RDPAKAELFLVEGDSAGGSAKQGRDRKNQAILPLRGKILNVERARFDKMLASQEIGTLIAALGTSIGPEEFSIDKARYHRIIIMTDADVDGSHIRTLLLTFFFRQMPELLERGYLYIAQPPLYRVKRGNEETYLKDDRALERFLIDEGTKGGVLNLGGGAQIAGADLAAQGERARQARMLIEPLVRRLGNQDVVEQAAVTGALSTDLLAHPETAAATAAYLATRLDSLFEEYERGWSGRFEEQTETGPALIFERTLRGVTESYRLDGAFLRTGEARALDDRAAELQELFAKPASLEHKDGPRVVRGPVGLIEAIFEIGRKGLAINRYKGLGEMNPEQLWATTLDPDRRTLLQVKVAHADEAQEVFSTLMGDVVEPRREFIQQNALKVANLDV
ncbi:MAG: DNA gyrase subunit B, partial [Alphaproteobacteria bacterium]|nr:DNA gyrase subunit B [Alphaproteobacteria bacterium]